MQDQQHQQNLKLNQNNHFDQLVCSYLNSLKERNLKRNFKELNKQRNHFKSKDFQIGN